MKRINPVRSVISFLVVFFLMTSIVCNSINALAVNVHSLEFFVTKKPNSISKSVTQFPEKVESENDTKPHNNYFFIHLVREYLQFSAPSSQRPWFYYAYRIRGKTTRIPTYLSKRSILI